MVRIRLRRTGAKNNPAYRIVVADQRAPRDGAFIETIGHYLPTRQPHVVEIDEAKAREWLGKGAQPSDTAAGLLRQKGILDSNNKITPEGTPAPDHPKPRNPKPQLPSLKRPSRSARGRSARRTEAPVAEVVIDPAPDAEQEMPAPTRPSRRPPRPTPEQVMPDRRIAEAAPAAQLRRRKSRRFIFIYGTEKPRERNEAWPRRRQTQLLSS